MRSIITLAALVAAVLPITAASAQTMRGYTVRATRLYSGPLRDYPTVRYVRRSAAVQVYGCLRDWSWCDVTYRANRGWIAGDALRVSHEGRRQGLAANLGIGVISFSFGSYWDTHYRSRSFYNDRPRWQTQYESGYRPEWGDRDPVQQQGPAADHGQNRKFRQPAGQHEDYRRGQQQRRMDQRGQMQDRQFRPAPAEGGKVRITTPGHTPGAVRSQPPGRKADHGGGSEAAHDKSAERTHR
jgi:uncharacterized protein YraI